MRDRQLYVVKDVDRYDTQSRDHPEQYEQENNGRQREVEGHESVRQNVVDAEAISTQNHALRNKCCYVLLPPEEDADVVRLYLALHGFHGINNVLLQ